VPDQRRIPLCKVYENTTGADSCFPVRWVVQGHCVQAFYSGVGMADHGEVQKVAA
jgi:hypothetical protein